MTIVWIILGILISLLATLPLTSNWVTKRALYLQRLNSIGFQENDRGLITKLEGPSKTAQEFFSADPGENVGASKNPGYAYAAAGSTLLLPNALMGLYKYFVYRRRMRIQERTYNKVQLNLLEKLGTTNPELSLLKDQITKEFFSS